MTGPGEDKKCLKNCKKLKVIIRAFGLDWGTSYGRCEMHPQNMGGHWKTVTWLETNI